MAHETPVDGCDAALVELYKDSTALQAGPPPIQEHEVCVILYIVLALITCIARYLACLYFADEQGLCSQESMQGIVQL